MSKVVESERLHQRIANDVKRTVPEKRKFLVFIENNEVSPAEWGQFVPAPASL